MNKKREREEEEKNQKEKEESNNKEITILEAPDKKKSNKNQLDYDFSLIQKEIQSLEKEDQFINEEEEEEEDFEESEFGEELEFLVNNFHLKERKNVFMPYIF